MTTHYLQHGVDGKRKDRRERCHIPCACAIVRRCPDFSARMARELFHREMWGNGWVASSRVLAVSCDTVLLEEEWYRATLPWFPLQSDCLTRPCSPSCELCPLFTLIGHVVWTESLHLTFPSLANFFSLSAHVSTWDLNRSLCSHSESRPHAPPASSSSRVGLCAPAPIGNAVLDQFTRTKKRIVNISQIANSRSHPKFWSVIASNHLMLFCLESICHVHWLYRLLLRPVVGQSTVALLSESAVHNLDRLATEGTLLVTPSKIFLTF